MGIFPMERQAYWGDLLGQAKAKEIEPLSPLSWKQTNIKNRLFQCTGQYSGFILQKT